VNYRPGDQVRDQDGNQNRDQDEDWDQDKDQNRDQDEDWDQNIREQILLFCSQERSKQEFREHFGFVNRTHLHANILRLCSVREVCSQRYPISPATRIRNTSVKNSELRMMPKKTFRLRVVLPESMKVDEDVEMVIMRCITGDMGVLPGHEPCSAVLRFGVLRIFSGDVQRWMAVYGGLAVIKNNVLTILTQDAEWPEEIDLTRAKADHEHARQRLREKADDMEMQNDQVRLRRSLVQIEVSSYSITNQDE